MNRIKDFLDRNDLTQRQAAQQMGITEEHLSRVMNGKIPLTARFQWTFGQTFGFETAQVIFDAARPGAAETGETPA